MAKDTFVIVGFGSQAKAWALNLKDSKRDFIIALNPDSKSYEKVHAMGMKSISLASDALKNYKHFLMLIPDDQHKKFFETNLSFLAKGSHFVYAHGYSLTRHDFNNLYSQFDHSLLAPKAIASEVRFQYETKGKIGAVIYTEMEANYPFLYDLAKDVGFTALYENHFRDETIADLFSEQALLCSILPYASLKSFNMLVDNGISEELAFMECFLELKSISAALVNLGPEEFFKLISPNALVGSEKGRELILNHHFDNALEKILDDIKHNQFYREVEKDYHPTRDMVINRWKHERLNRTYKKLKKELIDQ